MYRRVTKWIHLQGGEQIKGNTDAEGFTVVANSKKKISQEHRVSTTINNQYDALNNISTAQLFYEHQEEVKTGEEGGQGKPAPEPPHG